jgi:hypothetical protein
MIESVKNTLNDLVLVLNQLDLAIYTHPNKYLSNATIGEHSRHIIEMYQCLEAGYSDGSFSYDNRMRNKRLETEIEFAIESINIIIKSVEKENMPLVSFYKLNDEQLSIGTNYFRELIYNLEHCIHHLALIKVALIDIEEVVLPENFGVAASTVAYRKIAVN